MLVSAEGIGVARALAASGGYRVDTNRDLVALGGSNLLAGLSQGFVQLGGSSQTAAVVRGGGKTQLASLVGAVLILLLARDPATGAWGRADRHPAWEVPVEAVVVRVDGPSFYANAAVVKQYVLELARTEDAPPRAVVLDMADDHDVDVETLDMLNELVEPLSRAGVELRLAAVHAPVVELLRRGGLTARVRIEPTLDAAVDARA
jgi:MFS superfamily sulfate permease-like transporter